MSVEKRELTTVQITKEVSVMLGLVSNFHLRKKGPHVEWLIRKEYVELRKLKLIKAVGEVEKQQAS